MTRQNDPELIAGALQGSEKAFRKLVERYHPVVYSVVRAVLGDRDDVEDVVQEVFIKVYRGLAKFRQEAKFSTWIYRIARNEAMNTVGKKLVSGQPIEEVLVETPAHLRPDEQFHRRAQRSELEGHMARLDQDYRMVLELRYMGEKSYAQISETMGLPMGTVKSYIHRAKIELKKLMTRQTTETRAGLRKP
ncbi:MAG: sigma-70 family RNA polymerase sigma factor [Candidatus Krumholzibacteria bacterium]|nr:sigma-70 family RNA polymerase sigma factor [Candidatus Krumholzibacteria bacterium]